MARPALRILYGTQTGNCEQLAQEAAAAARAHGFEPSVSGLDQMDLPRLAATERVVFVISTYGAGEMPDNAHDFWSALSGSDAPRLDRTSYAVLALGDTAYDDFCQAGKLIDTRLEQLGAQRLCPRIDCDVDYEKPAADWIASLLPQIPRGADAPPAPAKPVVAQAVEAPVWSRKAPYPRHAFAASPPVRPRLGQGHPPLRVRACG